MNFDLINEIGHELKNKLGIIGNFLNEFNHTYEVDPDSLRDSILVYQQVIVLSKILSDLKFEDQGTTAETYILRMVKEYVKHHAALSNSSERRILVVKSKDARSSEEVQVNKEHKNPLLFVNHPKTGMEKILSLAAKEIAGDKKIEISLLQQEKEVCSLTLS